MIRNALCVTVVIFLALGIALLGECRFLIPYRTLILRKYGTTVLIFSAALFLNVFTGVYLACRKLSSKTRAASLSTWSDSSALGRAFQTSYRSIWRTDMDRDIERREPERQNVENPMVPGRSSGASQAGQADLFARPVGAVRDPALRMHERVREGSRIYSLSADERETMFDIGRFRTVSTTDLADLKYQGNPSQMRADLHSLLTQGLIQRKTVWTGRDKETETFWTLTKTGKRFLKKQPTVPSAQALYTGFVKPAELRHDAAIYRVYHYEAAKIQKEGGRVLRIVLDYELKKKAYSPLAKAKALPPAEYAARQAEIAREHGLKIVNGHITLPDLRMEYVDSRGVSAQMDLEVASESYHGSHAAEKAAAGFKIYASPDTAGRLSRALEEREITAEILWL